MSRTDESRQYEERLKERVQQVIGMTSDGLDFCELVARCEGAFPIEVLSTLKELERSGLLRSENIQRLQPRLASPVVDPCSQQETLPEPHPADFDWRFSPSTRADLISLVGAQTSRNGRVLLLCAPTLLLPLQSAAVKPTLIDHNEKTIQALKKSASADAIVADIFESELPLPEHSFEVCVIDPPWYPEHYRSCLVHAIRALQMHGTAFMSLLPPLTRPTAIADRRSIMQEAISLGFDLITTNAGRLRYEVPLFERAALRAHSIDCDAWRRGDLVVFRKVMESTVARTSEKPAERWLTFLVGSIQVKLRQRETKLSGFSAEPIGHPKPLDTVSRRFPRRNEIDAWNSRNIAYAVSNIEPLRKALVSLERGAILDKAVAVVAREENLQDNETQRLRDVLLSLIN